MLTPRWVTSIRSRLSIRGGAHGKSCATCFRRSRNAPTTWPCARACSVAWPTSLGASSISPSACSRPTRASWLPTRTTGWWRGPRLISMRRPSAGAAWWRPTRSCSVPSWLRRFPWARAWPFSRGRASSARRSWNPSPWPSSGAPGPTVWHLPIPTCVPTWSALARQPRSGRRYWDCWLPGWTMRARRRGRMRRSNSPFCAGACSSPASG